MPQNIQEFVPLLSSEAGSCLTAANWQQVGIHTVAYRLDALLLKPGLAILKQINNLKSYLGWTGTLVLNASHLTANKMGVYTITSTYDGSKLKLTFIELIEVILHLKPDVVLLPPGVLHDYSNIWSNWDDSIIPLLSVTDLNQKSVSIPHGIYLKASENYLDQLDSFTGSIRYVTGDVNFDLMDQFRDKSIEYIESDIPARDALNGLVYSKGTKIDLKEELMELQFEPIDSACNCPTCTQNFTKAYLHHLLAQTPLLCQRYLIQHNVFQVNTTSSVAARHLLL